MERQSSWSRKPVSGCRNRLSIQITKVFASQTTEFFPDSTIFLPLKVCILWSASWLCHFWSVFKFNIGLDMGLWQVFAENAGFSAFGWNLAFPTKIGPHTRDQARIRPENDQIMVQFVQDLKLLTALKRILEKTLTHGKKSKRRILNNWLCKANLHKILFVHFYLGVCVNINYLKVKYIQILIYN